MSVVGFISANSSLVGGVLGLSSLAVLSGVAFSYEKTDSRDHLFVEVPTVKGTSNWSEVLDGKDLKHLKKPQISYKKLIRGTTDYNSGNYVIYYGSEACIHCTGFLFGDQELSRGNLNIKKDKMSDGAWMKTYESIKNDNSLKKINFLMFEDVPPTSKYGDNMWTLPWAPERAEKDESSRQFLKVFQEARRNFKEKVPGTPTIIIYKNGNPKVFNHDDLPGYSAQKQKDESLSNDIELKKFIRYYFTAVK